MGKTILVSKCCDTIKKYAKINNISKKHTKNAINMLMKKYNHYFQYALEKLKFDEQDANIYGYKQAIKKLPKWTSKRIYEKIE